MRTPKAILAGAFLVCLLAAPSRGEQQEATRKGGCTSLDAAPQPAERKAPNGRFSATQTLNIAFTATVVPPTAADPPKTGVLTITTPKGHVYQEVDVPIGKPGSAGESEKTRALPGYQHAVPVAHLVADGHPESDSGAYILTLPPLLVGGTAIQQGGLYGKWKAEFRASDGSRPCSVSFKIDP